MKEKKRSNTIDITRIYDASIKAVWDAWTDDKQVAQWWGPRGFSITTHSKELKMGGSWNYTMHGPDGVNYPNITKYLEVEQHKKLVYDHGATPDRPALFRVTVLFSDLKGKTKMEMSMALETVEAAEETRKFIKQAGGEATWDRLAEHLEKHLSNKEIFVINRSFDASITTMFKMWTDPKHIAQWLAPKGTDMIFIKADIRTGGSSFYMMTDGKEFKLYGRAKYIEISPTRLVYTQEFCDDNETTSRHPMAPTWPELMKTTVVFAEEDKEQTRVTVTWETEGDVTTQELAAFIKERGGMTIGWSGSFDKLDSYLIQSNK
ncbi:MAG: SRPBCC family protein [Bacteriovoracaceae bacterium]